MIDTIVFDLGGVLVDWNPRYLYRKLLANDAQIENFLSTICTPEWNEKQDAGRPWSEAVRELTVLHPEKSHLINAYFERWTEMLAGDIRGTVEILEDLHQSGRYRLFALSNWSAETFPLAIDRFPFLKLFQSVVVSGQEKLLKPDARFFKLLIERHEIHPESAVFIDDVEKNILGAKAVGFNTIHFKDPQALRQKLAEIGVTLDHGLGM